MKLNFSAAEKQYLLDNQDKDPATLMLQARRYPDLPVAWLAAQIQARKKIKNKLPTWYQEPDIIYPPLLSTEQSSSEVTAQYKARQVSGRLLIDLTGGLGVDSFYFAQAVDEVIYVERLPELTQIAAHNAHLLGAANLTFVAEEATLFLESFTGLADWIYLDPARRGQANQKLHFLTDCEPDVLQLLPKLLTKARRILLKTSPMLDIAQARQALGHVARILVIAAENECKEVLYVLESNAPAEPLYEAVNLHPAKPAQVLAFTKADEEALVIPYSEPQTYIYEPNAAILKAGGFKTVAHQYQVSKLHRNSHLYTSELLVPGFPGRVFSCRAVCRYQKKEILAHLPESKANITVRNFPEPVAAIRKKLSLAEGGKDYLFATTDVHQKPIILVCEKAF